MGRHVGTWQRGRSFGVVFRGAGAVAGLERLAFPLYVQPEGEGPTAKTEALRGLRGTGLSRDTSALASACHCASSAGLRMLGRTAHAHLGGKRGNVVLFRLSEDRKCFDCLIITLFA